MAVSLQFHAELNDFLPRRKRLLKISYDLKERASIKDTIEALGVPHPEVYGIEVNGEYVDFSYIVKDGDTINVYPISAIPETAKVTSIAVGTPEIIRFVLDVHLGKLATSLRLLGFDTLYRNDYGDEELARISSSESRILLTRDCGLLMRSIVTYGYYVRSTDPQLQIVEIMRRFDLFKLVSPFVLCLRCNGLLETVAKESIIDKLPKNVVLEMHDFHRCRDCGQIYWQGSHYKKLREFINQVLEVENSTLER
jgi:uncharacterized protein